MMIPLQKNRTSNLWYPSNEPLQWTYELLTTKLWYLTLLPFVCEPLKQESFMKAALKPVLDKMWGNWQCKSPIFSAESIVQIVPHLKHFIPLPNTFECLTKERSTPIPSPLSLGRCPGGASHCHQQPIPMLLSFHSTAASTWPCSNSNTKAWSGDLTVPLNGWFRALEWLAWWNIHIHLHVWLFRKTTL